MTTFLPHAVNLSEWRDFLAQNFASLRTAEAPNAQDFSAAFERRLVGNIEIYDIATEAHTLERSPQLISRDAPRDVKIYLQLTGTSIVEQGPRSCSLRPGELTIFVTHQPYVVRFPQSQTGLLIKFPASLVTATVELMERISTTVIKDSEGMGAVLIPALRALGSAPELSADALSAQALEHLLEGVVLAVAQQQLSQHERIGDQLFVKATEHIDLNLGDPELSPKTVADALFVSLRNLQKHFADHNLTVTRFIRSRRLHMIRRDLANPSFQHLSIMDIAESHGVTDASYMSRSFKSEFGLSPRAYRLRAAG
ncbi:helix-turn-helix domain-containing protein [Corynebacterium sp.]|uniref:AraC-like ligand-binding domain-containing protein n=1 Tax=Corynebacterium sp. TaxID=1720 RepID=UPI0026DB234A|nr:helix-turn-helix domain-containing protein [Corynebacterium sp.]MDO5032175.1 helix-turn-helix domain-containing protein [Corynebacterium sp.]